MDTSKSGLEEESVMVTLAIKKETYELIDRISNKLGLDPALWINFLISSKLKGMEHFESNNKKL
jgi:hypothetical protein